MNERDFSYKIREDNFTKKNKIYINIRKTEKRINDNYKEKCLRSNKHLLSPQKS